MFVVVGHLASPEVATGHVVIYTTRTVVVLVVHSVSRKGFA
jgi:hypothetical protein